MSDRDFEGDQPWEFSAPLTVCIDFKSPQAYLAKDLVYELEDDLGVQADWLPFLVKAPSPPTQPQPDDDRGTRHRRHRARYLERDLQRYAAVRNLVIRDIYRQPDASLAAMALLWARRAGRPVQRGVIDELFAGYWQARLDIEHAAAVTAVLAAAGADLAGWDDYRAGAGPVELQQLRARLRAAAIFDVPALVVPGQAEAEIFYGRAHLPMVRWLLNGRAGPEPI